VAVIVLDANILVASPRLENRDWSSLINSASDWGIRIVVPEVAVMEAINVVTRNWASRRAKVAALDVGVFDVGVSHSAMLDEIDAQIAAYGDLLRSRIEQAGVQVVPTPDVPHIEIARRASKGRAPFTKDKDGYRDTLIWYSVLAVAHDNPHSDVWFVSDNHTDFGPKPPNWTGDGQGDREDCPILFHNDLIADLDELGLGERVHYVVSLARIEQHIASQFGPIDEADLTTLASDLDPETMAEKLANTLVGLTLDPEDAALPFEAIAATVVASRPPTEAWRFSEGARRGDSGWTARFSVDTEVDVAMVGASLVSTEHTKVLRAVGQVAVAPDGRVLDVAVDAANALTDDPMRARWSRRARRGVLPLDQIAGGTRPELTEMLKTTRPNIDEMLKTTRPNIDEMLKAMRPNIDEMLKAMRPNIEEMLKAARPDLPAMGRGSQDDDINTDT
jgi:PIN domain